MFTRAQLEEIYTAIDENDIKKIEAVINQAKTALGAKALFRTTSHFYIACAEGLDELVDFYLSSNHFNISELDLYNGLQVAMITDHTDVIDLLLTKYNLDPNYILPNPQSTFFSLLPPEESNRAESLLATAAEKKDDKTLKCLLSHERVEVNLQWYIDSEQSVIRSLALSKAPYRLERMLLLLKHGANPEYPMNIQDHKNSNITYKTSLIQSLELASNRGMPGLTETIALLKSWKGKTQPGPMVNASSRPAPRTFQPHEFSSASAFMSRYKARCKDPEVQVLTPFVIACMEGKGFLSVVECYVANQKLGAPELYQAIYLASWFQHDAAVEIIINKFGDTTLGTQAASETVVKLIEQARRDFDAYKRQGLHKGKNKRAKNIDAVESMGKFLSSLEEKHEHSSDEERHASGSHSPGHSTDSDPESAGSNNSPPRSPEKLATPKKPLSEKANKLLTKCGTPDKALRYAYMTRAGAEVINELCDLGLTFEEVDDDPKTNIFQKRVLISTKDANIILSKYPHCLNSVNSDGQTAAHLVALEKVDRSLPAHEIKAEEHSRIDKIKFLIEKGANIHTADKFGRFPLDYAYQAQMFDLAVYIEANKPKTSSIQRQPQEITYAAQSSPKKPLSKDAKELLDCSSCVDEAYALAVCYYPPEVQHELAELGLTFQWFNEYKKNVFQSKVGGTTYIDAVNYLIKNYPHCVNSKNPDGHTALHLFMLGETTEEDRRLVRDEIRENRILKETEFLLQNGASVNVTDKDGHTPLYYAQQKGYKRVVALLESHGARIGSVSNAVQPVIQQKYPDVSSYAQPSSTDRAPVYSSNNSQVLFTQPRTPVAPPPTPAATASSREAATNNRGAAVFYTSPDTASGKVFKDKKKPGVIASVLSILPGSAKREEKEKKPGFVKA